MNGYEILTEHERNRKRDRKEGTYFQLGERQNAKYVPLQLSAINRDITRLHNTRLKLYEDMSSRLYDEDGKYKYVYRGDSTDALSSFDDRRSQLNAEIDDILNNISSYSKYYDAETLQGIKDYLTGYSTSLDEMYNAYQYDVDLMGDFTDAESWNMWYDNSKYSNRYSGNTYSDLQGSKQTIENLLNMGVDPALVGDTLETGFGALSLLTGKSVDSPSFDRETLERELAWIDEHETDEQFAYTMSAEDINAHEAEWQDGKAAAEQRLKEAEAAYALIQREARLDPQGSTTEEFRERAGAVAEEYADAKRDLEKYESGNGILYYDSVTGQAITTSMLLELREHEATMEEINSNPELQSAYNAAFQARNDNIYLEGQIAAAEANMSTALANQNLDQHAYWSSVKTDLESQKEDNDEIIEAFTNMGYNLDDLINYHDWNLAREKYAAEMAKNQEFAQEHPVLATLGSIVTAPLTIVESGADAFRYMDNDSALINIYDNHFTNANQIYQSTVSGMIDEATYNKVYELTGNETIAGAASWLTSGAYSGVTSVAQSGLTTLGCTLMFGPTAGPTVALAIMGTEAAASTYTQAVMNGSTNGEALLTATAAGISEALFEKISLDSLIKIGTQWDVSSLSAFFKSTIKNSGAVFVQGLTEGSEEFLTEISNELADRLINGDHSSYYIAIDKYKKMGYSDEDARELADKDFLNEVVTALYGGFIGGDFSGLVATAGKAIPGAIIAGRYSYLTNQDYNHQGQSIIDMGNVNPLVEEGKGGNWRLRHLANEVAGVDTEDLSDKGMKRYAHDVGRLYKGVRQAQSKDLINAKGEALNSIKDIIQKEVATTGVENVDKAVDILIKKMSGKLLTREESDIYNSIKGDEIQQKIFASDEYLAAAEEHKVNAQNKKKSETIKLTSEMSPEKLKSTIIDKSGYKIGSEKGMIDATDEVIDTYRINSLDGDDISLTVKTGDKEQNVLVHELKLDEESAFIFGAIKDIKDEIGLDVDAANSLLGMWSAYNGNAATFYQGAMLGIMYGQYNQKKYWDNSSFKDDLPEGIFNGLYEIGRKQKQRDAEKGDEEIKERTIPNGEVKVTFAKGVEYKKLTKSQKAQVDLAQIIARAFGFNLEVFRSPKVNGKSVGENGSWQTNGNLMRLDIDAGTIDGKSLILFTQSHELTHYIKAWNKTGYQKFADFLLEKYAEKDVPVNDLVQRKIEASEDAYAEELIALEEGKIDKIRHHVLTLEEAYDEVVANACEDFLADPNIQQTILEIAKIDQGIAQKIKNFLKNLVNRLEKALIGLRGQSEEAKHVRGLSADDIQHLKNLWMSALVDARENMLEARARTTEEQKAIEAFGDNIGTVETNENGDITLISNEDNSVQVYSERTWLDGGKEALIKALTRNEHTQEEIRDTIKMVEDSLDYLKILAAGDAEMRGYTELADHLTAEIMTDVIHGKQVLHTIVNNGDYPVNLDLALICKKRVAYMRLMSRLIEDGVMENVVYDGDAIAKVNAILRKNGFETACLGCFVESRRLQFQTWAEVIVQEWNGEVDRRNKNAGSFNYAKNALTDASSLTDEEIARLEKELKGKKTNDQGNLNLGQGSVRTRMGKLLDAVPTLQKHITVADLLTPEGITKLKAENPNLFSLVKSRYGAASPKIVQNYNPYASELANLTFESVKRITTNAVSGATDYIAQAEEELKDSRPIKPKKSMSDKKFNEMPEKAEWDAKVQTLAMRKYLYDIGGARMQSFSDFMIENVFDYLQIFADLSANRFPLHSYTKEASFLRLFGMTGAKINGSLIAHVDKRFGKQYAGLLPAEEAKNGNAILVHTADGDFAIGFDDYARHIATKGTDGETFIQSIGMKDIIALQLDKRYSANVGSITIGVSDIQILAMLDSPLFRMVIPYHASGMLPQFAELVGVDLYNDYTDYQNTTVRQYYDLNKMPLPDEIDKNGKVKQGKLRKANGDEIKADTSYSFNAELQKIGDPKQVANNYIAWCNEFHEIYDGDTLVGYAKFNPKFSNSPYGTDFTKHENYYKLLEDFNVYDGITEQYAQQGAVQMIFPSAENRLSMQELEEYKQRLRDTGIFNEKEIEKYAQKANMTFDELVKAEVKNRIEYEDEQNPKFDSTVKEIEDELLKSYKRIDKRIETFDEYLKLKESDSKASKEALKNMKPMTRTYFQDRDSTGRELSPGQIEFFKDSKVRDENGSLMVLYHGTPNRFTTFRQRVAQGWGKGIYFTDNKEDASEYGENIVEAYLNITNPYIADTMSYDNIGAEKTKAYRDFDMRVWEDRFDEYETYEDYKNDGMGVDMYDIYTEDVEVFNKILRELGYDGIIAKESNNINGFEIVAFNENQPKLTTNLNPTESDDIRYQDRVTPEEDSAYMDAYYDGDEDVMQSLVDKVADRLGYKYKAYHHTENGFTVFDLNKARKSMDIQGFYFSADKDAESEYGSVRYDTYLKMDKPYIVDSKEKAQAIPFDLGKENAGVIAREWLQNQGYDSVIRKAEYYGAEADEYIVFDSSQIKSAEPMTFADDEYGEGNIIPLSERFNEEEDDIRYSDRVSNKELADRDDTALYIKNTKMANYIGMIFSGLKTEETRSRRTLDAFIGKDFYVTDGEKVYGKIVLGEPHKYTYEDFHKKENQKKHRVPVGDTYDIKKGGVKWAYPIESYEKFDKPKKMSDSTEYKNSFQARQTLFQDREIGYGKLTQERIDDLISYNRAGSRVDYASAWIATIDPTTFINLTLPYETRVKDREVFDKEVQGDHGNVMGDRDYIADLESSQMPRLRVDIDTGKVIGHDGRHRMRALEMAGASRTPIEIIFYKDGSVYKGNNNGDRLESIDVKRLTSQFDDKFYLQYNGYIHDIIPLNEDHRAEIEKEYLVKSLDIKYGNAIAYQDRPYQPSPEDLGLYKKENEKLKSDVDRLKEMLKLQGTVTHGKALARASYEGVAKKLLHSFGMKRVTDTELLNAFVKKLDSFYNSIINADADGLMWETIFDDALEIARWVDKKLPDKVDYKHPNAVEILRDIREKGVRLSESQKAEAAYYAGSLAAYRKMNFGNFKIVNEGGISLTELWEQIVSDYPGAINQELLGRGEVAENLPSVIVEVIDTMRQTEDILTEDEKLQNVRNMAMEIYDSYWQIPTVRTLADKHQQKVNLLKGQHRAEMDALKEKSDSKLKDTKGYYQDMVKRVRADKDAKMEAYKKHVAEQKHKNVEGRNKTATKNKIKKVVKALESLYNNPTKERNVKIEFQDMVKKALIMADAIFDEGNISSADILSGEITIDVTDAERKLIAEWNKAYEARQGYQNRLDQMESSGGKDINPNTHNELLKMISACNNKLNKLGRELSGVVERQKGNLNNNAVKAAIESLAKAYRSLNESSEGYANAAYNEYVDKRLTALVDALDGVTVKSMTLTQLDELYQAYKMVLTTVRTANEIFVKNKRMSVIDMGESVINEIKKVAKITPDKIANIRGLRDYAWKELKPIYAFKRIGSDTFMELFNEVMKGESVYARDIEEAKDFFQGLSRKYGFASWDLDAITDFKLADGRTFSISLDEIMSIYAYSKRNQAIPHMTEGGFVFSESELFTDKKKKGLKGILKRERTTSEAYRISYDVFNAIENSLTEEQKKFADEMQKYLTSMGDKGNEISRVLYGIDIFNEEVYFPLESSRDFMAQNSTPAGEVKLKNSGMTKATVPHAKNPIVLKGFMDVWNGHVDKMSTYHAMVLPIENINKVFTYTGYANQDISVSVKSILNGAYGSSAADYISTFLQDLNGGVKVQSSGGLVSKLMSNFKKTAVAASLSVVVQQPFAVIRAMAEINPKYFTGKSELKHNETWEELKRYAPVAIIKEMGGFDIGSGKQAADYITAKEYDGIKEKAKGFVKDSNYRDESYMWLASKADEIGWNAIWNAVKNEIADTTTLKKGSEEFLQACGDRFTEVIAYTQVYDSVVSRSGWMRNKGEIAKMATAFMGELTTTINMLFNAILQVKRGTISKGKATAIVGATVASIVLSAVAKSFIAALRDDDEDESYWEKYGQALGSNIISDINPLNMLPFVRDVVSLFEGWDVERTDMAVIKDIKDAFDGLDSDTKSDWRKTEDLLGAIAALFGIPAKNLIRTAREGRNLIANIFDENTYEFGDVTSGAGEGVFGESGASEINKALKWGNTDKASELIDEAVAEKVDSGMTKKEAEASVRSSLTSYWKERYIEAYKRNDADEMRKIRKILASTGLYDDVVETCTDWIKSIKG